MNDLRYYKRHSDPRVVGQEDFLADCASAAFVRLMSKYGLVTTEFLIWQQIYSVIVMENIFPLLTLGRYLLALECIYCQT